ncbi:Laminin subunit alpha [Armadillidium vulgare]|nr:Laminin subunit alpha [Armadillidium vulgare]
MRKSKSVHNIYLFCVFIFLFICALICNCDARGTTEKICNDETGKCLCAEGYSGERCDNSAPGFWGYPLVQYCGCHERGSLSTICDSSGKCACHSGYAGRACDQCSPGYFNFPECEPCNCDQAGSIGISCDANGHCQCKYNFVGIHCDTCRENFYNFPLCEDCNCHPAGVLETFAGCGNAPVGELCECKERVTGRICNKCKPLYWNLLPSNRYGCEECACHTPGTVGALTTCDMIHGQCTCKPNVVSRACNECKDGTFNLMEDNLFGCSECQCNIGGSNNNICEKITGQCSCRHRIQGQRCDQPMKTHYFPTLYQQKYEVEDGRTPQNTPVRYGYDERIFPGYSWRGYAVYSELQKETLHDVFISKPSLYRLIFYYMNPLNQVLKGKIVITPDNPLDDKQEIDVHFQPTKGPELMTVSTPNGFPLPFCIESWDVDYLHSKFTKPLFGLYGAFAASILRSNNSY